MTYELDLTVTPEHRQSLFYDDSNANVWLGLVGGVILNNRVGLGLYKTEARMCTSYEFDLDLERITVTSHGESNDYNWNSAPQVPGLMTYEQARNPSSADILILQRTDDGYTVRMETPGDSTDIVKSKKSFMQTAMESVGDLISKYVSHLDHEGQVVENSYAVADENHMGQPAIDVDLLQNLHDVLYQTWETLEDDTPTYEEMHRRATQTNSPGKSPLEQALGL